MYLTNQKVRSDVKERKLKLRLKLLQMMLVSAESGKLNYIDCITILYNQIKIFN